MGAVVKINFQPVAERLRNAASVVLLGNKEVSPVGKHRALGFVFSHWEASQRRQMKPGSPTAPSSPSDGTCCPISILSQYIQKDQYSGSKVQGHRPPFSVTQQSARLCDPGLCEVLGSKHLEESTYGTSLCNLTVVTTLGVFCSITQCTRHFHRHMYAYIHFTCNVLITNILRSYFRTAM